MGSPSCASWRRPEMVPRSRFRIIPSATTVEQCGGTLDRTRVRLRCQGVVSRPYHRPAPRGRCQSARPHVSGTREMGALTLTAPPKVAPRIGGQLARIGKYLRRHSMRLGDMYTARSKAPFRLGDVDKYDPLPLHQPGRIDER
jgi:hypothetical protein